MKLENQLKFNSKNKADIQAYLDYINIVGNDDNGKLMSEKEYESYKKDLKNKKREHLYVYWINSTGFECKVIGPESMCFCNHRYKNHDYNNTNNKKIKCKKCSCKCYEHVPCYGANDVKCLCHHSYRVHDLSSRTCKKNNCKCQKFNSKFTCNCGEGYDTHKTVIYTKNERIQNGKPVDVGWFGESLLSGSGGMELENYGQIMNDIYDTEFKNMERKPDGKKIMYKNGVAINNNIPRRNNLNSNNEYYNYNNNNNYNSDYFNSNNGRQNKDNFSQLKSMTYEEAFGINKKYNINNNNNIENENSNNMKQYGGFIMRNDDYFYNNKKRDIIDKNNYFYNPNNKANNNNQKYNFYSNNYNKNYKDNYKFNNCI